MKDSSNQFHSILYKRNPNAILVDEAEKKTLFQSETCEYIDLNETAFSIWQAMDSPSDLESICKRIGFIYEKEIDDILPDVKEWLCAATEKKIVSSSLI